MAWQCFLLGNSAPVFGQSAGSYECVGGPKFGSSCDPSKGNGDCSFCEGGTNSGLSCTKNSDCAPDGHCRGVCEKEPPDPVGSPQRFSMFRDDQIWITSF